MKIKDLQPGQGNVNIEVTVKSIEEPKVFNKYGRELRVATAVVTDGEDEIKLSLWNDDINKVKVGSIVKIENGYVTEFQGEKQLTSGKFGKIEVVEGETAGENGAVDDKSSEEPVQEPEQSEDDANDF